MRAKDVQENCFYLAEYGSRETIIKITHTALFRQGVGPWWGVNLKTGRQVKIKSVNRLRREVSALEVKLYTHSWWKHREAKNVK